MPEKEEACYCIKAPVDDCPTHGIQAQAGEVPAQPVKIDLTKAWKAWAWGGSPIAVKK